MSLYNEILGTHPFAKHLLIILSLAPNECGRLRDIYLRKVEDKLRIIVFTRNGGGNRETYQSIFDKLSEHPNYICNYDDDYDNTYANIEFSVPEKYQKIVEDIFAIAPEERGLKLFQHVIKNMNNSESPFAQKALQVGEKIVEKIIKSQSPSPQENCKGTIIEI